MRFKKLAYFVIIMMNFSVKSVDVLNNDIETNCVKMLDLELARKFSNTSNDNSQDSRSQDPASQDKTAAITLLAALPASDRLSAMRKQHIIKETRRNCKDRGGVFHETTNECAIYNVTYMNMTKCTTKTVIKQKISASHLVLTPAIEKRLTLGGVIISEFSLFMLLGTYWFCKELQTSYGKCVVILSITTMVEQLLPIISLSSKNIPPLCTAIAIMQHWVLLIMFCWMASIAFDLYQTFAKARPPSAIDQRRRFKIYTWISEAVPALIVVTCIIVDFSSKKRYIGYGLYGICFITGYWSDIVVFIIPVGCVLSFNLTCMCITLNRIRSAARKSETLFNKKSKNSKPSLSFTIIAMKLSFLLGLSWTIGYLGSLLESVVLLYIFLFVNSYQGCLIFIAFCCNQRVFNFYKRKLTYFTDKNAISTSDTMSKKTSQQTTV